MARAVPGKRLGLLVASLTDGEGELADPSLLGVGGALMRRPVSGLPVPLGDRRSSLRRHHGPCFPPMLRFHPKNGPGGKVRGLSGMARHLMLGG